MRTKFFKDDNELTAYIDDRGNEDENKAICFGVTFDRTEDNRISYRLRFNGTSGKYQVPDTDQQTIDLSRKLRISI